jgi:cysteine desulfurase/selenocysteine lyase
MNADGFRARFPGASQQIYMDVAARGVISQDTRTALNTYLDSRMLGGGDKVAMFALVERLRGEFAGFIGADADEIAFTKNVSEGLNAIVAGFDFRRGDQIVYCAELEHPNNVYPWRHLAQNEGVELVEVPAVDGEIDPATFMAALTPRTRMVSLSSVTFAPGLVTDLQTIGRACRERGIFVLVDAVQSVGVLKTNTADLGVDALAVSTQKGLLGLYGMGYLYCRREWAEQLSPAYLARFSVDLGDAHEAALGEGDYALAGGARRFEIGNYNFAGAVAADASLTLLKQLTAKGIEEQVRMLAQRLAGGLRELGLPLIGPVSGPARGSIVCIGTLGAGGHDSVDDERLGSLNKYWADAGVRLSIRRGLLRLSLHAYNSTDDVDQVLSLASNWVNKNG